jgi:hypothetical protein
MPSDEIKDFCNEILKAAGMHLMFVSGVNSLMLKLLATAFLVCSVLSSSMIWLGGGSPPA